MNTSDVVKLSHDQKIFDILENAVNIPASGPLPEQYCIQAYKLCLDRKYIYIGGPAHGLTTSGSELHWMLVGNLFKVRSKNNNVFKYSSYWGSWSRVLWHESDQKLRTDSGFNVGPASFVELNLTGVNPDTRHDWERVAQVNIRAHWTSLSARDQIVGTLPGHAVYMMRRWLCDDAVDQLLHANYLPFIDFEKGRKLDNGGFKYVDARKEFMSLEDYAKQVHQGFYKNVAGLGHQCTKTNYNDLRTLWEAKRDSLIITKGMLNAED